MKKFALNPSRQKSYYGKATVIETVENNQTISRLLSYSTIVAEYNHHTNKMTVHGWFSKTTSNHINDFLELYGFDRCNKKQLENYEQ